MSTQIQQRQIADGAINNNKVMAGAGIITSKLADGSKFIQSDGSVAFLANQSVGGFNLTNVGTPSSNSDAANKSYVDGLIAGLNSLFDSKPSVKAATTANITLSGTQTIDGVSLSVGDRVLVKDQTTAANNGIYLVASGSWTRVTDMDSWAEIPGALVSIEEGTANADYIYLCTSNSGGTLGTTAITWQITNAVGLSTANFVDKEIPSGSINGSNATFTLSSIPISGTEHLYINGVLQESGAGNDYTISGLTITMSTAPLSLEKLRCSYRK